jgi:hypothetical protein
MDPWNVIDMYVDLRERMGRFNSLYSSPFIVRVIKSRKMRWIG